MEPQQMPTLSQPLTAVQRQTPLLLDEPQTVWIVQAGSMGLFTVPVKDGTPVGARSYLSSLGPGAALFATTPDPGESYALLAVPFEDTWVLRVSQDAFQ